MKRNVNGKVVDLKPDEVRDAKADAAASDEKHSQRAKEAATKLLEEAAKTALLDGLLEQEAAKGDGAIEAVRNWNKARG